MNSTYGLEYGLFFGVPSNKIELIHGVSRWAFPFLSRDEAEAHFHEWLETFRRWKQVDTPTPISKSKREWRVEVGGIRMELFPRPIDIRIPIAWQPFEAFLDTFHRREFWPGQPPGLETGWDCWMDLGDIRMNVWSLLSRLSKKHGGKNGSRSDIALAPGAGVGPDGYYYRPERSNIMIGDRGYFCGAPDLIVEVLSAPSRWLDRGPRVEAYLKAGVRHLWRIEPATETIEVYELRGGYELIAQHGANDCFTCPLFQGSAIQVEKLFDTQSKSHDWPDADENEEVEPVPEWIIPPEMNLGLEYFFHLGHPERRWEFWGNKARSMLAFGSSTEARARLDYFLTEVCRWESLPRPKVSPMADDVDHTEAGRFQLTRRGRLVLLDVAIDGGRHRDILTRWVDRDAWDWGEEQEG